MYSEADLQSAVAAGALSPEAANALRSHAAGIRSAPVADEEHFRLITGFNDIFVTIACMLVIFAAAALGGNIAAGVGGLLVAAACWAMAEMFTRRRRMALPSIVLLLGFVAGLGFAAAAFVGLFLPEHIVSDSYVWEGKTERWSYEDRYPWQDALMSGAGGLAAALAAFAHWKRFRVAITIAAGVGALVMLILSLIAAALNQKPSEASLVIPAALVCGLGVFAYAMRWDIGDRQRTTQKADIAFWLHLLAAPLIAHPLFYWMGVTKAQHIGLGVATGVLAIYAFFAVVALSIDRRALLVSALAYVLIALGQLLRQYGAVELNLAITGLVIGSALLCLSAFWSPIRSTVVSKLTDGLRERLPATA